MTTVAFYGLNISAMPEHPVGIYRELFTRVAGRRVNYFGEKVAAISKPSEDRGGYFWGLVHTWTEIDQNQKYIDTVLLKEPKEEDVSKISIPANIGFNSQVFYYVFREDKHILVLETKNNEGVNLSWSAAEKIFKHLFSSESLRDLKFDLPKPDYVEVSLLVEQTALDKIFALKQITQVEIMVSASNSDDNTDQADQILQHLRDIKARSQYTVYKASDSKVGIKPDATLKAESAAALRDDRHGYVQANGRTDDGKRISRSSKSYPKRVTSYVDKDNSTLGVALRVARDFFSL